VEACARLRVWGRLVNPVILSGVGVEQPAKIEECGPSHDILPLTDDYQCTEPFDYAPSELPPKKCVDPREVLGRKAHRDLELIVSLDDILDEAGSLPVRIGNEAAQPRP
jgi:hypothetical protein